MRAIIILGWKAADPTSAKRVEPEVIYCGLDGMAANAAAEQAAKDKTFYGGSIGRIDNPIMRPLPVVYQPIVAVKVTEQRGAPSKEQAPVAAAKREELNAELFKQREADQAATAAKIAAAEKAAAEQHEFTLSLLNKTKAELIETAKSLGLDPDSGSRNAELISAILEARQSTPQSTPVPPTP